MTLTPPKTSEDPERPLAREIVSELRLYLETSGRYMTYAEQVDLVACRIAKPVRAAQEYEQLKEMIA